MDLRTFIAETLEQIVGGVTDAQAKAGGDNIAAEQYAAPIGHLMNSGTYGVFTGVDFDVAVTATTSGTGKAQVAVFGLELGGGGQHEVGRESRIKFTVPVRLPGSQKDNSTRDGRIGARTDYDDLANIR